MSGLALRRAAAPVDPLDATLADLKALAADPPRPASIAAAERRLVEARARRTEVRQRVRQQLEALGVPANDAARSRAQALDAEQRAAEGEAADAKKALLVAREAWTPDCHRLTAQHRRAAAAAAVEAIEQIGKVRAIFETCANLTARLGVEAPPTLTVVLDPHLLTRARKLAGLT